MSLNKFAALQHNIDSADRADVLEFAIFKEAVQKTFISAFAKDRFVALSPLGNTQEIVSFHEDLKAIFQLYHQNSLIPIFNDAEFHELYGRIIANEGPFLVIEPQDYMVIMRHLFALGELRQFLDDRKRLLSRLSRYIDTINPHIEFARKVERIFDDNGEIKDSASSTLSHIRKGIRDKKRRIQQILQEMLNKPNADKFIQEQVVVMRNGRYTIACKTNFGQYIHGIIHDRSASGQTVFVEPTSCVPLNNDMQNDLLAEAAEIVRILAELYAEFIELLPALKISMEAYTELVFRICIASFYYRYDIAFPEFGDVVELNAVHHPLLLINKGIESIAIDISFGRDERLIVVSGPNTGGKTASLKSLGLNHIIAMCGLPVFAKSAKMVMFSGIYADIGDKQSIVMDLSTFSSHMMNIRDIMADVSAGALVLFDELGTGTDPKEGAALAIAILDYLYKKRAYVMITTHFSELKMYAFNRNYAKIYAVDFDYESFEPRYALLEGVAGNSDPIIIAKRLGFPHEVVSNAEVIIADIKSNLEVELEEINLIRAELEHSKKAFNARAAELEIKEQKITDRQAELDTKLAKRELELLEDSYALFQKGKRLASERTKHTVDKIDEDISVVAKKIEEIKAKQKPIEGIKEGDVILLEKYNKLGKIISLDNKSAYIDLEGMKVRINRKELIGSRVNDIKAQAPKVSANRSVSVKNELLLVGKRVDEALELIDKYIDEAQLSNYDKAYIIHGRGSGQLRSAIHDYLRSSGRVKSFEPASNAEGGDAVTVVIL